VIAVTPVSRRALWRGPAVDLTIAALLFTMSVAIGAVYVRTVVAAGGRPRFYQEQFAAAVMLACGRGFQNVDRETIPALNEFLLTHTDAFSCANLPDRVPALALAPMQRAFRYQMSLVALTWGAAGIAWSALAPLYGVFFGTTVALAYALFRTGMGRSVAALCAAALAVSTIHLIYLPHLRDYSKAPFVLALVLLLAWLVSQPVRPGRVYAIAAAYGIVLGIGIGFRNDLLMCAPLFVPVLLFFLPGPLRAHLPVKAIALAIAAAAFVIVTRPMLAMYAPGGGGSVQHVTLLGLISPFNDAMGVTDDGLYEWGYDFKDEFVQAEVASYANRVHGRDGFLEMYGLEYDRSAAEYIKTIATTFPADVLVRGYASVIKVLAVPYNTTSLQPPTWVSNPRVIRAYHGRERILRALGILWPFVVGVALIAISWRSVRLALFAMVIVLYLGALPALQFNERHFFHLEFLAWWALGFVLYQTWQRLWRAARSGARAPAGAVAPAHDADQQVTRSSAIGRRLVTVAGLWTAIAALLLGSLWTLRQYQQRQVRLLLERYVAFEKTALDRAATPIGGDRVLVDSPARSESVARSGDRDAVHSEYVVAEFGEGSCDELKLDVTFRYAATEPAFDFSRSIQVRPPLTGDATRVFFPAFFHRPRMNERVKAGYGLKGLELPASAADCLTGLYRVRDVRGVPLLMSLQLPPGWREATLYQTIDGLERRSGAEAQPEVYAFPPDLPVTRKMLTSPVTPLTSADVMAQARNVSTRGDGFQVRGVGGIGGEGRFLYLAETRPRAARIHDLFVAQGTIVRGGISLGLVQAGEWLAQVPVTRPGEFVVVIQTPKDATCSVVLANNLPGPSLWNELTIRRAGWIVNE
jgi:hypothetical protein